MKTKWLSLLALIIIIVFNAWIYRAELTIKSELNDNTFQFAMVKQMEGVVGSVFRGRLPLASLIDNWNQIWSEGAPLALYYNHLPQLATVLSYKILHFFLPSLSLFIYFEILKYIFLCLTPLSFFLASQLLGFSPLASLSAALLSALISTYGSYGLDPSSYLFAGFGLTSQLQASFFMPLAFGFAYRFLQKPNRLNLLAAVIFNFLTIESHLGVGTILLLSEAILTITQLRIANYELKHLGWCASALLRGVWLFGLVLLTNAYFLIPALLNDAYRNFSHWEGPWKFNSFGWGKVTADFLNGQLFDYNRLPIVTALVIAGFFVVLLHQPRFLFLAVGFAVWFVAFFGRTTWDGLFNFLPGLADFYLHRFILGVHFFGIFLAALGLEWLLNVISTPKLWGRNLAKRQLRHFVPRFPSSFEMTFHLRPACTGRGVQLAVVLAFFWLVSLPVRNYANNNHQLILKANADFSQDEQDWQKALSFLQEQNQGQKRIYAGTPGGWGRTFTVGQTPVYQRLSVAQQPVMNFYAHSWSLASETEPFFNDQQLEHYQLYNVGYILAPEGFSFPFSRKIGSFGKYQIFQEYSTPEVGLLVPSVVEGDSSGVSPGDSSEVSGYFDLGRPGPVFYANKKNFMNIVHQWQISAWPKAKIYPLLFFDQNISIDNTMSQLAMTDLNNYLDLTSGEPRNLWQNPPFATVPSLPTASATIVEEPDNHGHQRFSANINTSCSNCLLVFKQTYHPNWQVTIDGERSRTTMIFPAFVAIKIPGGSHQIVFEYQPAFLKIPLVFLSAATFIGLCFLKVK